MLRTLLSFLRTVFGMNGQRYMAVPHSAGIAPVVLERQDVLTRVLQPVHTVRLRPAPERTPTPRAERGSTHRELLWHGITDRGMARDHNEDSFALLDLGQRALFVVADGMGGHDAGEVASRIAMEAVCDVVREGEHHDDPLALVEKAMQRANTEVKQEALRNSSNMGTTLTAALIVNDAAYIGSVGDSRAYWIENGSISQITEDHSLVAKLAACGKLTKEEARNHPRSNLLYRTIGAEEAIKAGLFKVELKSGGMLLLCTDGLWGEMDDADLREICTAEPHTETICARLVQRANANGGRDNITAIVVKIN